MENRYNNSGIISGASAGMANSKYYTEYTNKSSDGGIDALFGPLNRHFNASFFTLYKKKMAELKMLYIITNILGWPLYIFSILQNIESVKSIVLLILGAIFILVKIWGAYEKNRTTKIANDRQQFKLDCEKMDKEDERRLARERSADLQNNY